MPTPPPLPPRLQLRPFHVREAADLGVPDARLRRRDLDAPFRGIRSSRALATVEDRCAAYLQLLGDHWFSHATAARLWGFWLPRRLELETELHVTSAWPGREPRMRGVVGHRVTPQDVSLALLRGMRVTSPADTWCALAASLSVDELIAAGDGAIRRQQPTSTLEQLREASIRYGRRRGAAAVAKALPQLRSGADSAKEVALRLLLIRAGLPEPVVNLRITDTSGDLFGDLAYPSWLVLVEYDGRHHLLPRQAAADILRLERLQRAGWTVVRVVFEHLDDPTDVVSRVARALAHHGWRPRRSKLHLLR